MVQNKGRIISTLPLPIQDLPNLPPQHGGQGGSSLVIGKLFITLISEPRQFTTHCPLPTAHYPLPTIHYPLPTTHCPLPTAHYPLPTTHCPLPTAHCPLPTAHYPLPTAHYPLPTTHCPLTTYPGSPALFGSTQVP